MAEGGAGGLRPGGPGAGGFRGDPPAPSLSGRRRAWLLLTPVTGDLRSVNAQIEFLLRESLRRAGRLPAPSPGQDGPGE